MKTGLVSITFRQLSPREIIELVQHAELDGIEWGGDVHVPHGDTKTAQQVLALTRAANLQVACYGSYYRAGVSESEGLSWAQVLATAKNLEASLIRVWAGNRGTNESTATQIQNVIDDLARICELSARENIAVALEFHGGTLTDSGENALQVLAGVQQPNLKCLWQPRVNQTVETRLHDLELVAPYLANSHVFQWNEQRARLPLAEGENEWRKYLQAARKYLQDENDERFVLLEFVRDDSREQFLQDAHTLKNLLG